MVKTRNFAFEGKVYEIRISVDGLRTNIRVFLYGEPANGYIYSVDLEVAFDAQKGELAFDPREDLIKTAENDVKEKKWEQYLQAISAK